jgi:predicted signal transduction protein with EAL and GGDEF domain
MQVPRTRVLERRRRGIAEQYEFCLRRKDGSQLWAFLSTCAFTQADNTVGALAMVTDITQRRKQQMEIEFLATHDVLTQLPNRGLLHRRIDEALAAATSLNRSDQRYAWSSFW